MYKVNVEVKKSTIEGKGVLASEDIRKDTITWKFDPTSNQMVVFNENVSEEPFFRANRDIRAGEELTVDYGEFDSRPEGLVEEWIKN